MELNGRCIAICATVATSTVLATSASAAAPEFVLRMPESETAIGSGAGKLNNPRGIAGDPASGHVYISDLNNARIDEYTAWGRFVKAWGWGVADGSPELQVCGPSEPEAQPVESLCQGGTPGAGKGQLNQPLGIAVDAGGNSYVFELANDRVQKFSPAGEFLLMFGGEVNKTKVEEGAPVAQQNVCPVAPADVCQAGTSGEAASHFTGTVGNYIAYSTMANAILVGDKDRIQSFNLNGTFKGEIPFEGSLSAFAGKSVNGLDVDSSGNIYFSLGGTDDVYKLNEAGTPLDPGKPLASKFDVETPLSVAVDDEGSVYAIEDPPSVLATKEARMVEFDGIGSKVVPTDEEEQTGDLFPYIPFLGPSLNGLATNICEGSEAPGNLYLSFFKGGAESYVNAYGTGPDGCEPPPPNPPEIDAQYAVSVGREEATLSSEINPRFFKDTTYYVEYGTGKCSEGGCLNREPISPVSLTKKSVNAPIRSAGIFLGGLKPGADYHYRFVAQSTGGGPVRGVGGEPGVDGEEGTFRTFAAAGPAPSCAANEAFRIGPSAKLPDCRAYEMVSPLEKGNADVAPWLGGAGLVPQLLEVDQSAVSGGRFAYSSEAPFADPQGASFMSEYMASRGAGGWSSQSLSPPRTESPVSSVELQNSEINGFSADLCTTWIRHNSVAPIAEGAIPKYANLYQRSNCAGSGTYNALTSIEPPNRPPDEYTELRVQGSSSDGTHTIFSTNDDLIGAGTPALDQFEWLLYESTPEGLRFVCYLPGETPNPTACSAGTAAGPKGGNESSVHNAISADGSRIFWSAYSGSSLNGVEPGIPGRIYVRIDGQETVKVSGEVANDPAWYWTAADDGSKAIFQFASGPLSGQLYEFDVDTKTATQIASGVLGPMGASEDASRIYFASSEDLDGGGPASAGGHNLYLYDAGEGGGTFTFVMALAAADIGGTDAVLSPIEQVPAQRSARVSPDGLHAVFTATVNPAPGGYDNLDAVSGEPDQEVYRYDATQNSLLCISCNPTNARPVGDNIGTSTAPVGAAARIQGWEIFQHAPRVLSDDGSRVFFESHEALVPRDTNRTWDVYEWETPGAGGCTQSTDTFSSPAAGCIDLISSGESPAVSTFFDADSSGENVFFGTQSSLVGIDYGLNDVYDARVGGGFAEPVRAAGCEGEACQSPPPPPPGVTPASAAFEGPSNPGKLRCRKGKRKVRRHGKARCVSKAKHHRGHKRVHHNGGAGR